MTNHALLLPTNPIPSLEAMVRAIPTWSLPPVLGTEFLAAKASADVMTKSHLPSLTRSPLRMMRAIKTMMPT
jgi:hypothetical protein